MSLPRNSADLRQWLKDHPWRPRIAIALAYLSMIFGVRGWALAIPAMVLATIVAGFAFGALKLADLSVQDQTDGDPAARRQRARNIAIAMMLGGLVTLFYVATLVRLGGNVMNRPL